MHQGRNGGGGEGGGGSALCSDFFGSWLLPGVLCVSTRDAPLSPFFGDESSARGYMKRRDTMREEERRKKQNIRRSVEYTLSVRSLVRSGVITSLRSYTVEWPTCTNYREADSRPRPRLLPPANRRPWSTERRRPGAGAASSLLLLLLLLLLIPLYLCSASCRFAIHNQLLPLVFISFPFLCFYLSYLFPGKI